MYNEDRLSKGGINLIFSKIKEGDNIEFSFASLQKRIIYKVLFTTLKYMKKKRIIYYTVLILVIIFITGFIVYKFNSNNTSFLNYQKGNGIFTSLDGKISFKYPKEIQYQILDDNKTTRFVIVQDCGGDIGKCGAYAFELVEDRQGDINKLYKDNIFYKESTKNYYGKKNIEISNHPAYEYSFCDSTNCTEENMIYEIFIEYDNKIYSFMFGTSGSRIKQDILRSIKFN